jgi:hypothetical protein
MAMTIEQLTKKARNEALNNLVVELKKLNKKERKEKKDNLLAEKARIQAELAELNLKIQRLKLTHEEKVVWNEKDKTPPTSEDEEA